MLISVISLQIFSKFINETSGYHQYIINKSWISWVLDVGNIHEIHHLMFFRMTCDAGGLRETFRGMMAASSRPWFDKAMTLAAAPMPPRRKTPECSCNTKLCDLKWMVWQCDIPERVA
jgi:hypothetical protein